MKAACSITSILLLSLMIGCTRQAQPTQNSQKKQNEAAPTQAQSSPAETGRGTPAEAKAMLQQAVAHYNSVGRKQALADFTAKKSPFADRDLYVACIGSDHRESANGGYPSLVGTSADAMKDADNKPLGRTIWDMASSKGEGSVEYRWHNPVSGKIERKVFFVQKVGDDACGVGAYNPE
jgi:cytochrome c